MPPSIDRKLRIQFHKEIRKGFVKNAFLDPRPSAAMEQAVELSERLIVRVDPKQGGHYWFSDRSLFYEDGHGIRELLKYGNVKKLYWMFKDGFKDQRIVSGTANFKEKYFDRLEIDTDTGVVVLEGLDQAYLPVFNFFSWIID
jgi:hypothetical protein